MNTKRIDIFFYLLLLLAVAGVSSACSFTKIKAQSPNQNSAAVRPDNAAAADSSGTSYKPPKRVSKDVIKKDEKPAKTQTK